MDSSPSPDNKDDHNNSSGESLSRGQRTPFNQYHVYNFGEATGNTVGSPAYYYPGYPSDYYYLSGRPESQPVTGSSVSRLGTQVKNTRLLATYSNSRAH